MSDTSVMGAIGQAMGKAAEGAVLGRVIGGLKDEASDAIDLANDWRDYANRLERQIDGLNATIKTLTDDKKAQVNEIADLKLKLSALTEKLASTQLHREINFAASTANKNYGKQIEMRLHQMEKALQHSSADKAALRCILKPYEELVDRLNLDGNLTEGLRKKADAIWDSFMSGEILTEDEDVQQIIDQALVPKREGCVTF